MNKKNYKRKVSELLNFKSPRGSKSKLGSMSASQQLLTGDEELGQRSNSLIAGSGVVENGGGGGANQREKASIASASTIATNQPRSGPSLANEQGSALTNPTTGPKIGRAHV